MRRGLSEGVEKEIGGLQERESLLTPSTTGGVSSRNISHYFLWSCARQVTGLQLGWPADRVFVYICVTADRG